MVRRLQRRMTAIALTLTNGGMKARESRRQVIIPARMRSNGAWGDVCIRNISSRGMLVQAANPPERGTYIEIFKARHIIVGRVMWRKDRRFGIHTRERIDVSSFVEDSALPKSSGASPPAVERRRDTRRQAADVARRLERSRRISAAFQFACVVACSLAAAVITVSAVRENLARPLEAISSRLPRVE